MMCTSCYGSGKIMGIGMMQTACKVCAGDGKKIEMPAIEFKKKATKKIKDKFGVSQKEAEELFNKSVEAN